MATDRQRAAALRHEDRVRDRALYDEAQDTQLTDDQLAEWRKVCAFSPIAKDVRYSEMWKRKRRFLMHLLGPLCQQCQRRPATDIDANGLHTSELVSSFRAVCHTCNIHLDFLRGIRAHAFHPDRKVQMWIASEKYRAKKRGETLSDEQALDRISRRNPTLRL